ncbi:MAG: orotate phosphoribosyltransferase [Gammaproteobacteria bacterium RIFCSPHIGHO2_12_FULL_41_20]|nr:MAG: orotate phosphoribosyltransferase [Gammaproteobacteria bacterium RIFCSPHIGHO2_12_FULL_41_20]
MHFINSPIIATLYKIGAIRFGQFTLKSGKISPIYLDLRRIISYPDLLRDIANLLREKTQYCHFDLLCGVPYTALPIATALSLQQDIPMVMRRKEQKDYGTKQKIEGIFQPGQVCLIIEDVITTGSSILETAKDLTAAGLVIHDVAVLINREQSNQPLPYHLHSLFTLTDILHQLIEAEILSAEESSIVHRLIAESSA